jgi:hypothetical protein
MKARVGAIAIAALLGCAAVSSPALAQRAQRAPPTPDQVAAAAAGVRALQLKLAPATTVLVGRFGQSLTGYGDIISRVALELGTVPTHRDSVLKCDLRSGECRPTPPVNAIVFIGTTIRGDAAEVFVMTEDYGGVNSGVGFAWRVRLRRTGSGWSSVSVENVGQS